MRVVVDMEIETEDYGGQEFRFDVERLIKSIDKDSRLIRFKMRQKYGTWDNTRDVDWTESK